MKTVKFHTFGCKVNQYETQAVREYFISNDFVEVKKGSADYYVVNTCTVTHVADSKCLKSIRQAKRENPEAVIVAMGCLAEKDEPILLESGATNVISHSNKHEIFNLLGKTDGHDIWDFKITDTKLSRAFVKIQDGCDNRCSFCKVNIVRGQSKCRPIESIILEVEELTAKGVQEIVLCGTNLGSWKLEAYDFSGLLAALTDIKLLGRLRLSSIEAPYVDAKLTDQLINNEKLAKHFHIPFQSGDSQVLRDMDKFAASRELYDQIINNIRAKSDDFGISCDIMVAFPTETEEAFENTLSLIKKSKSVRTHIFPFSPRPGTKAAGYKPLDNKTIMKRLEKAHLVAAQAKKDFMYSQIGKEHDVVFDTKVINGRTYGYSSNYLRVVADKTMPGKSILRYRAIDIDGDNLLLEI